VTAALFCERIIQDKKDEAVTIVRIVDTFSAGIPDPGVVSAKQPVLVPLHALVLLKAGKSRGRHKMTVEVYRPSGERMQPSKEGGPVEAQFVWGDADNAAIQFFLNLQLLASEAGVYWFHVVLDDKRVLTQIPFEVQFQRSQP